LSTTNPSVRCSRVSHSEYKLIHLELKAQVPGTDQAKFAELAKTAKENCPVSKLLKAEITLDAKLV
jgi:osmotically inducible protein OsmC